MTKLKQIVETWTTNKPTKPGPYWLASFDGVRFVQVKEVFGALYVEDEGCTLDLAEYSSHLQWMEASVPNPPTTR